MSFNRDSIIQVKELFKEKRNNAIIKAENEKFRLYSDIPLLAEIDRKLSGTGIAVFEAALQGGNGLNEKLKELEKNNTALQAQRKRLLEENGYTYDPSKPKFECSICEDTGYTENGMCECFRSELINASIKNAGLAMLAAKQSFDTFSFDYYQDNKKALDNIKFIVSKCREFSKNIDDTNTPSLLLLGATGLGKTHLSTATAVETVKNGFDVVYETAQNIIADFEYERFEKSYNGAADRRKTDKYFDCELLVIDDLGTEVTNQFTLAYLYNIINTRIIRGGKMIINTNLTAEELRKRYSDRITSRLLGEFQPLLFIGSDIRAKKLKMK